MSASAASSPAAASSKVLVVRSAKFWPSWTRHWLDATPQPLSLHEHIRNVHPGNEPQFINFVYATLPFKHEVARFINWRSFGAIEPAPKDLLAVTDTYMEADGADQCNLAVGAILLRGALWDAQRKVTKGKHTGEESGWYRLGKEDEAQLTAFLMDRRQKLSLTRRAARTIAAADKRTTAIVPALARQLAPVIAGEVQRVQATVEDVATRAAQLAVREMAGQLKGIEDKVDRMGSRVEETYEATKQMHEVLCAMAEVKVQKTGANLTASKAKVAAILARQAERAAAAALVAK
jgi:hypothetical protein